MSKKKTSKQSESHLPDGGYVPVTGYNYGLDGFDFDTDYGDGVEDGAVLPEAYGLAELPDGMLPEAPSDEREAVPNNYTGPAVQVSQRTGPLHKHMADPWGLLKSGQVMDEGENAQLGKQSGLADLDWLDPTLQQDEARLPVNPVDKSQSALEKAWTDRRTNGLELIPNRNKEIERYQAEVRDPGQVSGLPGVDGVKLAMMRAMRRSACGYPLSDLLKEAARAIGRPDATARAIAGLLTDEHGLAGNVFIRAAAFPGMHNGRWDSLIKKKCSGAAFIIAEPNTKMAAFDNYLGKKVVSEIPWDDALSIYLPRLKVAGADLNGTDPREILKKAFLKGGKPAPKSRTAFVTHQTPAETVGLEEAKREFAASETGVQEKLKKATLDSVLGDRARRHVMRLVSTGVLTKQSAAEIVSSGKSPKQMLRAAAEVLKAKAATYETSGIHNKDKVTFKKVRNEWATAVSEDLKKTKLAQAREHVSSLARKGYITDAQAKKLIESDRNAGQLVRAASHVVSLNSSKRGKITESEVRDYEGRVYKELVSESRTAKTSSVDIRKLVKWARIQMSEGVIGKDFDDLISARFSKTLVEAAGHELIQIREAHEGLSGQLYVDTEAYATPDGTKGCDRGAARHRTNGLKFALCMPRCGTCRFANKLPDGTSVCQKYNKTLVDAPPVEDPAQYQAEAIRLAGASDAEITASLFASYDPGEFSLSNDSMTGFDFNDTPDHEELSGVFFGGLHLGGGTEDE